MMTINEYREEFINDIEAEAIEKNDYPINVFIDKVSDLLINDYSLVNDMEKVYFSFDKGNRAFKNMHIDGAFLDLTSNTLNLLIADYNPSEMISINNEFIMQKSNLMINYFINTLNGYFKTAEESDIAAQLAFNIINNKDYINKIHLFIISTNTISKRVKSLQLDDIDFNGRKYKSELDVITFEMIYNTKLPSFRKDPVEIDVRDYGLDGIQCIKAEIGSDGYSAYLAIVPGQFLSEIYKKYGPALLESNVRSFLNVRGAVNKGIRGTILNERNNFFTYNNGISTIASEIETSQIPGKGLCITKFTDFQIINGGQTTASLASASIKDNAPLDKIFVQMKLTILSEENPEFVSNISRYANSQNKVTNADLNSNHPFYIRIEQFSNKVYAPPVNGQTYQTLWFFERARGQYDQNKMMMTKSERQNFERIHPKNQKFTKTDLAKYLNSSYMKPYNVAWGAEVNLTKFQLDLEKKWDSNNKIYNEVFYRNLIGKAILFKTIEKVISNQQWYIENKAYRAQLVPYTFAKLVFEAQKNGNSHLNYRMIWDKQCVPDFMIVDIEKISKLAFDVFYDKDRKYMNIGEYCKREDCWNMLKAKEYHLTEDTKESLITNEDKKVEEISAKKEQKLDNSLMDEIQIYNLGANYWEDLKNRGIEQNVINQKDVEFLDFAIKYCKGISFNLSPAQSKIIISIKEKLDENGIR